MRVIVMTPFRLQYSESAFSETDLAGRNCVWVERYGSMTVAGPIVTIAVKYRQLE